MEVAKAALATAELNYNSTKELFAKKVVSAFNLKTSENSYLTAKAQLAQAEAQEVNAATTCLIRKSKVRPTELSVCCLTVPEHWSAPVFPNR